MTAGSKGVLVTGATGLVGSHTVERLIRQGWDVTCLVRDPARLRWLAGSKARIIRGDCTIPGSIPPALEGVSTVIHAAGLTKARWAREYYEVNHLGTRNILAACAKAGNGVSKFVLVSSLAAAGPSRDGRPVQDTDTPRPVSDYGKSKLFAEQEALRHRDRFPVVILRPSAVYGPRDSDMFELFRWAAKGLFLKISGGERYLAPCYVEDLAEALVLAAEKDAGSGSIYFVSEDRPYSWSAFRDALLRTGGVQARTVTIPYFAAYLMGLLSEAGGLLRGKAALTNRQKVREARQAHWIGDVEKIRQELGFTAATPLELGFARTWKWYREQGWI